MSHRSAHRGVRRPELHVETADTVRSRFRGLLGRAGLAPDRALWLPGARRVHTFGMRFAIDVAYLDRDGVVLHLAERVPPGRVTRRVRGASGALETSGGVLGSLGISDGDRVVW